MRAARAVLPFLIVWIHAGAAFAHVGSPHIYIEDTAGPYPLTVACEMPPAVPGEATVQVLLDDRKEGEDVAVRVREIPPAGDDRAPEWVPATPSRADRRFFSAPLPLMVYGLWHAEVEVSGTRGHGTIRFPIAARVPVPYGMGSGLSIALALLTAVLLASLASILIGLGRDADRLGGDENEAAPPSVRRGRRFALVGSAIFLSFVGAIMYFWGTFHAARAIRTGPALTGQLEVVGGPLSAGTKGALRLAVFDARHAPVREVAADHGKMMHLVVAKWPGAATFDHLHPTLSDDGLFAFSFTPPEPGRYLYFADVLLPSGEGDTVTGTFDAGPGTAAGAPVLDDLDDSYAASPPMEPGRSGNAVSDAGDGMKIAWIDGGSARLRPLELSKMTFELRDASDRPVARLDPYMGMAGHMLILRSDGTMFAHVHPTGTVAGRMGAMPRGHAAMMTEPIEGARAAFPYAFPKAGFYRVWIQMKYDGKIRTGVFDVTLT